MGSSTGRICVITGGASGIGLATLKHMQAEGATIVALDLQRSEGLPADIDFRQLDISQSAEVSACIAGVLADHGWVDVLVNAAGIGAKWGSPLELGLEDWDRVMAVNFRGTLLMARAVLPAMCARKSGSIINVGSTFGLLARRYSGPYSVSKAAVIHLTRCLAIDVATSGVRVNCVCPGLIETPMTAYLQDPANRERRAADFALHAMNRAGGPEQVASVIAFLASDGASFMTGEAVAVDGGYTAGKWPA